jgi:hypothetical protein
MKPTKADLRKELRLIDQLLALTTNKLLIKELKGERGNIQQNLEYYDLIK